MHIYGEFKNQTRTQLQEFILDKQAEKKREKKNKQNVRKYVISVSEVSSEKKKESLDQSSVL